jgi:hypothetical protein
MTCRGTAAEDLPWQTESSEACLGSSAVWGERRTAQ